MRSLKSIIIAITLLLISCTGAMANNIQGQTGPSALQSVPTVSAYIPQGAINSSNLPLSQLIGNDDTVYYFDTSNGYVPGKNEDIPKQYGDDYSGDGNAYPLIVSSRTTWVILNNAVVTGAIQVASGAKLNVIVCPTKGPSYPGLNVNNASAQVDGTSEISSFQGIVNNGSINIAGVSQEDNNPNYNYMDITFSPNATSSWNIREDTTPSTTSSFNIYSAYTELRYISVSGGNAPCIENDSVTVANDGVLQVSSPSSSVTTSILSENTSLNVSGSVVLGESSASNGNTCLSLGTTNVTSSNSSLIGANGLTPASLTGVQDSLIVNIGSYDVNKNASGNIIGSILSNSSATVVGNVTFGWGGQFDDFVFNQTGTPTNPTLSVPSNTQLTIPSTTDVSLETGTVLDNNGTINVVEAS